MSLDELEYELILGVLGVPFGKIHHLSHGLDRPMGVSGLFNKSWGTQENCGMEQNGLLSLQSAALTEISKLKHQTMLYMTLFESLYKSKHFFFCNLMLPAERKHKTGPGKNMIIFF
jgi:hypothetical protein